MNGKPELIFADLEQGRKFRPLVFDLSPQRIDEFMEVVGDRNPLYQDTPEAAAGPFGAPLAPPGLAAVFARLSYLQDHEMPSGGVLAGQEFRFLAPFLRGDVLTVQAEVAKSYLDEKGRRRVEFDINAVNRQGLAVCRVLLRAIWPK